MEVWSCTTQTAAVRFSSSICPTAQRQQPAHPRPPQRFSSPLDHRRKLVAVLMPNHHLPTLLASITAGLLATIACGASTGTTAGTEAPPATSGAEANTGEGIPVTYTD